MIVRIGYAYRRGDKEFHGARCERMLIDLLPTRECLTDIMSGALRLDPGDVLVVRAEGDLGKGQTLKRIRDFLAAKGVSIEVFGATENSAAAAQVRGIPHAAQVVAQRYWHLPGMTLDGINEQLRLAGLRVGEAWGPYRRHQFIYALGNQGDEPRVLKKPEDE